MDTWKLGKRIGRAVAPVSILTLGVLLTWSINRPFGTKIAASFFNAENFMALWTMGGTPLWQALIIGIACSSADIIFVWYWIFCDVHPLLIRAEGIMDQISTRKIFNDQSRFLRRIVLWSLRGLFTIAIKPSLCEKLKERYDGRFYTVALIGVVMMGFVPGCIWLGIFLIVSLELTAQSALPCLLLGNSMKVAVFGSINATVAGNLNDGNYERHQALLVAITAVFVFQWIVKHTIGKRLT